MDCISMGVDALTYTGNIFVEWRKRDGHEHRKAQLVVCAISLSLLVYFTLVSGAESWATARRCRHGVSEEDGEDDVDGRFTLAFGAGGVVFDLISLVAFYRSGRNDGGNKEGQQARPVNMLTAL